MHQTVPLLRSKKAKALFKHVVLLLNDAMLLMMLFKNQNIILTKHHAIYSIAQPTHTLEWILAMICFFRSSPEDQGTWGPLERG